MKKKYTLILDDEFSLYCELNNITDIDKLAKETFNRGFAYLKYGESPSFASGKTNEVIVEKEVIKEIPVEVIKEVIINNTDNTEYVKLKEEYDKLKEDMDKILTAFDAQKKGTFMKNSNLSSLYDE